MTNLMFKKMALALALATAGLGANAATYDLGQLDSSELQSGSISFSSSFDDIFSFTVGSALAADAGLAGVILMGDLTGTYEFGAINQAVSTSGAFASDVNGSFGNVITFSGLTSGTTYALHLVGSSTVASGDPGSYSVTLAPVPEPETYGMLLAGLGLIGAVVRRRREKTTIKRGA